MIRTSWFASAAAAKSYYRNSDYFASVPGEWLGKGSKMLGLTGEAKADDFDRLADNLHPQTGEPLTTYTRDGRRVGLDMTFNATKSVSIAREMAGPDNAGDPRIETAHREAVAYTMRMIEKDMQARVRAGGANENRTTGNLVAYRVTHRDTRINADDQRPDMSLHDHVFIFNATYDAVENKWKAAEIGQIKHDAPFYEAAYHNRLAHNLKELGYGIERSGKGFEITGISKELRDKFSRRSAYINAVADKLGITNPETKAKLGATTRLGKVKETADDLNAYYVSRLTAQEKQQLASLEGRASRETSAEAATKFAIGHLFERKSVVDEKRLYETALRQGIGSVTPEEVEVEARRQGLLVKNGDATTKDVLAEEARVIAFARDGKGTCRPMGHTVRAGVPAEGYASDLGWLPSAKGPRASEHAAAPFANPATISANGQAEVVPRQSQSKSIVSQKSTDSSDHLSPEQAAIARHVWTSPDRVMLVRGGAGTGKTHTMKAIIAGIDRNVVVLAPSADASRGVLRSEGFADADTVARFLQDKQLQQKAKDGVIYIDEAGLLGMKQLRKVFDVAESLNARVILQGDKRQHGSVERGATLRVLEEFTGLPVAELSDIRRQSGKYKEAVTSLSKGDITTGYDVINELGWVQQVDSDTPIVDAYMQAVDTKRSDQNITDRVLAVAPTHVEASGVTGMIRAKLKERGEIGTEERLYPVLVPLHWTEAERGDLQRYDGTEVVQYHRNGGSFKAGNRVAIADFKPGQTLGPAQTFAVYAHAAIPIAEGERIRITANGTTADKKHKLNNGSQYTVEGFEKDGSIRLTNGWVLAPEFSHISHGYVSTSHASQGKSVDKVLIAMGQESLGAINAEQFYVSVSRGRHQATIFTDVAPEALRDAVQKADIRRSATELVQPLPQKCRRNFDILSRARSAWNSLRGRHSDATPDMTKQREYGHVR